MFRCGFRGLLDKVKLLYDCESDIEASDYDKRTVAHLAAGEDHYELLEYLVLGTDFNFELRDRWGHAPLDEVKDEGRRLEFK